MREVMLNFSGDCGWSEGCIKVRHRVMYLHVDRMLATVKEEKMTFDNLYAQIVSHELIHQILFDNEGKGAAERFDNICYRKYPKFKHWVGGVGAKP